jgi:hypothetical protein
MDGEGKRAGWGLWDGGSHLVGNGCCFGVRESVSLCPVLTWTRQ